jgi:SagB-type dehydrogenase family enzyme
MRVLWVFTPIAALAVFVIVRLRLGKPLTRRALDVSIALLLLAYLVVTAGLGLFWVARMDLPVFDWHYLFGYALLVVAAAHVSLQLRGLLRFFRPRSAAAGDAAPPRSRFRAQPGALSALAGALLLVALGVLLFRRSDPHVVTVIAPAHSGRPSPDGQAIVERLHRESSYSRGGLFRAMALSPERPPEIKAYPRRPRQALSPPAELANLALGRALRLLREGTLPARTPPTVERLSTILFHANGVTAQGPGYRLRAAPSSGALYPTDVYVLPTATGGLRPGAYYYDSHAHSLVAVGGADVRAKLLGALPDVPGLEQAPLLFVLAGTFDRTAWKYTVRSYRYLGLDAGHLATNLLAGARALDLACELLPLFDDARVAAALELDPQHEAPLAVVACGGPPLPRTPAITPRHARTPLPSDPDSVELTRLSSSVTSVTLTGGFDWFRAPPAPRPAGTIPLPPSPESSADLFQTISQRRSFREFADASIPRAALAQVLAEAASLLGFTRPVPLVDLYVAVRAVTGVEPGTYRYDAATHALSGPLHRGEAPMGRAGLDQALLGQAAFVLSWALLDERSGSVEGARDFRHACFEAGLSGEAAYLSSIAAGLGISGVGAFYDDEVASFFRDAPKPRRFIYLAGVGAR